MTSEPALVPIGTIFGRLTVVGKGEPKRGKRAVSTWRCQCQCGSIKDVTPGNLRHGNTVSCGCYRLEQAAVLIKASTREYIQRTGAGPNRKHGQSRSGSNTPAYGSWRSMLSRCKNPNRHNAAQYLAKGITVCERWQHSFENFFADMGPRPEGRTLDRIDGNKGYSPDNCRWATNAEQAANRAPRKKL